MNKEAQDFWLNYNKESLKKFEQTADRLKSHERTFWISLMTIQATLLGISMALSQYLGVNSNIFMKATWILLIFSIGLGILVFKCSLESESSTAFKNLQFSIDTTDFNLKYERNEFKNEEEKIGLFCAAFLKFDFPDKEKTFTPYAKELAAKYKAQLPSEKYFKDIKYSKPIKAYKDFRKFLNKNVNVLMACFYIATMGAFVTLLISIFIKK